MPTPPIVVRRPGGAAHRSGRLLLRVAPRAALLAALLGCGESSSSGDPPDAAADATPDAMPGADAMPDAMPPGADAMPDAMPPGADAMPDAMPPAPDAAVDATPPLPDAEPLPDAAADATPPPPDGGPPPAFEPIRGRFDSAGPARACGQLVRWDAPDGFLLRMHLDLCGDDMAALADTIVANLDAAEARGGRAVLSIAQGPFLPASWIAECESFRLEDGRFQGDICLPWDPNYRARLDAALLEHIGPAVAGHPALAGVYFTITTMTNGAEMHFRVPRSTFPDEPVEGAFARSYLDVMDVFQQAFDKPILLEGGHCVFADPPGGAVEPIDCQTPLAMYRHARDTYGRDQVGVAVWNCAERFWWGPGAAEDETRPLLEEAMADGVSFGCQTVGNFTEGACRFTDDGVADYGEPAPGAGQACPDSPTFDAEAACVDTMNWFVGTSQRSPTSVQVRGTWAELWTLDLQPQGIYQTSEACRAAVDQLAPGR